ncbi:glycosyltransferase family 4 protein [Robiginitalea sp. SC105]|uniref:glycosyltransferase family 4 protein n=1 Tax=Robiginitalea sp. SC105 TaxID=2762332 RepID=UPI00163B35E9|nr:glycosyltransferase family 4 protein [Robiginitalea sp. SC105]MBC2840330.1 glycosyltransferase family 4 protein [Robiginitalea sp. SC105]
MSKPLKIDFLVGRMNSGGAQRVIANLSNYLVETGYEVRIITFMGEDAYNLDERVQRLRFHSRKYYRTVILTCFATLLRFYSKKKNRPDIISAHIGDMGLPSIPIAKLYGIKIIVSEHSNHLFQKSFLIRKVLWNHLYKKADAITVLTNYDLPYFSKRSNRVVVMENPLSFSISERPNIQRDPVILAVGSLNRYIDKGFDSLLRIASEVLPKFPTWKLKFIGEGKYGEEKLQALAKELGIDQQVEFLGFRSDVQVLMRSSEIFILTSKYEGLPMVLLEALSQRMACISYDCITGPSEIIDNNTNGFLIEDQNMDEMANKLKKLIENESLRSKFQKNAPEVLEKYKLASVGNKWIQLINDVV